MAEIDPDRLLADLRALAGFGACGTGVNRVALSEADIAARRWLAGRMAEAGLDATIDRLGNVYGRAPEAREAVLIGSHTDTVPRGGWLDGALGVVYGLEVARALRRAGLPGVDVISFQDEEGSWLSFLGSLGFLGALDSEVLASTPGPEGRSLAATLDRLALAPDMARLDPARHLAFFEAHIEQGPRLEAAAMSIGVVTGIVGIRRFRISAIGRADHAGTTPMAKRRDAGRPLFAIAATLPGLVASVGAAETVWNIGVLELQPGAANVVPARAAMVVEMRDLDATVLDRLEAALLELVAARNGEGDVEVLIEALGSVPPTVMDADLAALLEVAATARGLSSMRLPSGAGHDAMILGRVLPSAMLFVPSIGGRSHDVAENTADSDIVAGCTVLADAVERYLRAR